MRAVALGLLSAVAFLAPLTALWAQDEAPKEKPRFFFEGGKPPTPPAEAPPAAAVPMPAAAAALGLGFEDEADLAAWQALDAEAIIDLDTEEGAAHTGQGCLRMTYVAREGAFEQLTAQPLTVEEAGALSFAIKADLPTNLSFGVVERGGAYYQQFAAIPANEWTLVSVPLPSLVLAQDTPDLLPGLQPDQIIEIRLADLANLPGSLGDALGRKTGVQRLCLDDVGLAAQTEAPVAGAADPRLFVDGFDKETIHALAIGDALLQRVRDGEGHALRVLAEDRTGRWKGFVAAVGQLDLRPAEALSLRLKASEALVLNVTLEEWDSSKYSQRVALEAGDEWTEKTIPLDALVLETDSDDENGQPDREQLRVVVVVAEVTRAARFPVSFDVDDLQFR